MAEDDSSDPMAMGSWEELDDSGELDRRLGEMKVKTQKKKTNANVPIPVLLDGNMRTAYQPQVKILQRDPEKQLSNGDHTRPVKPTKTLQQREAEYAEARQRILGSASSEETTESRPSRLVQNIEEMKITENVLRQPKGPDGTKGFTSPR